MKFERKKVLFILPSFEAGGAERVFSTLFVHLDRGRFEPHIAVLRAKGAYVGTMPKDETVHDLNVSRARYSLPGIIRLVWKLKPHVILSTLGHLNLALLFVRSLFPRGTKFLVRETTIVTTFLLEETQHPRLWAWFYWYLYRRADGVICSCDAMMNDFAENFKLPREKLVRIYNPVDTETVQEQANIGENPFCGPGPHLVAAGRISREKGFDLLLDAMPVVLQHLPNARLAILGDGPLKTQLTARVQDLRLAETVSFLGFQQNPWRYLKHADLFVLPSRYEGLPNILLETLALGTPVVATDCPGAIREVRNTGTDIALVPPENPKALAEAIVSACGVFKDSSHRTATSQSALRKFDLQKVVGEYSELLLS
jgi:glycosyltransferase involved in cell wall biosynthesis